MTVHDNRSLSTGSEGVVPFTGRYCSVPANVAAAVQWSNTSHTITHTHTTHISHAQTPSHTHRHIQTHTDTQTHRHTHTSFPLKGTIQQNVLCCLVHRLQGPGHGTPVCSVSCPVVLSLQSQGMHTFNPLAHLCRQAITKHE